MSNILMCGNEPLGLLQGNASDISFDNSGGVYYQIMYKMQ